MGKTIKISGGGPSTAGCAVVLLAGLLAAGWTGWALVSSVLS